MSKTINLGRVKGDDATINGVNTLTITTDGSVKVTQDGSTMTLGVDLSTGTVKSALDAKVDANQKGSANGIAELDSSGKVPESQLPSYVDDVIEGYYYNSAFYSDSSHITGITPESGKIYVDISSNLPYRWSGSTYVVIASSLALGETSSTAYRGDRGKTAYDHSQVKSGNPHNVTKSDVGLGNVVNTGDSATPVSGGTTKFTTGGAYTELAKKMNTVSGSTTQFLGWNDNGQVVAKDFTNILDYNLLTSIAVKTAPSTTRYYAGSTFDSTGMVVTATYRDKTTAVVTGYTVTPTTLAYGTTSVTITYTENKVTKTTTQNVTVNRRSVTVPSQSGSIRADKDGATAKSPTWSDYDQTYMSIVAASSTTSAATVGTYNVVFRLKDTSLYQWADGSVTDKTVTWTLLPAYTLYGFEINQSESDPASRITYLADNANFTSAKLTADNTFSYGNWKNAWFISDIKVVLMAYDGTITKELNKNNYAQDVDGNSVTITSSAAGNVMVGIPKVYIKVDTSGTNPKVYFSDIQIDSSYHCFAHTDVNGAEIDYTYMAAYDGYSDGTRMRSVSGVSPTRQQAYDTQVSQAKANNTQGGVSDVWDIGTFGDRELITFLLMLIGKSTDTQTVFGYGNDNGYNSKSSGSDSYGVVKTGTLNDKGLFAGYTSVHNLAVKVFGIENFWGNIWKRVQGLINNKGTYLVKLCRSSIDGTTSTEYSSTGSGYLTAGSCSSLSSAYITLMNFNTLGFMLPTASSYTGSSSTYYCDYASYDNSQVDVALFGGASYYGVGVGAFALALDDTASVSSWYCGASLSAKPKAS